MEAGTYTFGGVCVDRRRMTVERDGVSVSVEPKALDVLMYLIDHRDRLVTKDELLDAVWKDTFVTPNALTRVIAQLRKALGDDAQESRMIETASKRGYRFIAPIAEDAGGGSSMPGPAVDGTDGASGMPARAPRSRPILRSALGLTALAIIIVVVQISRRGSPVVTAAKPPEAHRLTTRAGYNGMPAISADGRSVAYVSDRTGSREIYVTGFPPGGVEVAITANGGENVQPDWSPDGQWLAFHSEKSGGVWIVQSGGGVPRQVVDFGSDPSWSPDGQALVFTSDAGGMASQSTLWTVRRNGADRREITKTGQPAGGHRAPAWSHNGRFVVFSLHDGGTQGDLWASDVYGGGVHRIASADFVVHPRISWDDRWVYWAGGSPEGSALVQRVPIDPATGAGTGAPEPVLPMAPGSFDGLSIARDGTAVFGLASEDDNLWASDVRPDGPTGDAVKLTDDAVRDTLPTYARDGRLAYNQIVPGRPTTSWILRDDGTGREALLPGSITMFPEWAPDGARLLVQGPQLAWVELASRRVTSVPVPLDGVKSLRLSPDGREIAFHKIQPDGVMNVWIRPLDGGAERQVTRDREAVSYPAWSPDGRWLAVEIKRLDHTHIGVVPADGRQSVQQLTFDAGQSWPRSWAPDNDRIAFAGQRAGVWNVFQVSRTTKTVKQLTHFTSAAGFVRYPAWSPTGARIVFERSVSVGTVWTVSLK